jgi:SAM-dependent methyltransferase
VSGVNYNFLLALFVIAIGFILKSGNIISEENGKVIAKLVFNITLPSVIFRTIVSITITPELFFLVLIPIIYASILFLIAYIFLRNKELSVKGLSLMSVMGFNVVHLAFPLIQGIWGQEGLKYGCGSGSYTIPLAKLVGPSRKIYAADIHPLSSEKVLKKARKQGLDNNKTIQTDCKTDLDDGIIDKVILIDILHDLDNYQENLAEFCRVLKHKGVL